MSDATLNPIAAPAPSPITSRALLRQARDFIGSVWNRHPAIWPIVIVIVVAERAAKDVGVFGPPPYFLYEALSFLVDTALFAGCIRAILGRSLWVLDSNFWRFVAIRFLLNVPALGGAFLLDVKLGVAASLLLAVCILVLAVVFLRFIPWPVGALAGNHEMTAGEAWRLTRGGFLIIVGAFLQVALVLAGVGIIAVMLTYIISFFTHSDGGQFVQLWKAIAGGLVFPIYTSLDVAIYKLTIERKDLPVHSTA